jgi:hypothetical protein
LPPLPNTLPKNPAGLASAGLVLSSVDIATR